MGQLPATPPKFALTNIPFNLETLFIILPYSLPLALVGILESLMTAANEDEMTETKNDKNREIQGARDFRGTPTKRGTKVVAKYEQLGKRVYCEG